MLEWTVEVRDPGMIRVGQLVDVDLGDVLVVPRKNEIGSWSIKLPDSVIDEHGMRVPHALCLALREENAGIVVTEPGGEVVLSGPMILAEQQQDPGDPDGTWTIVGVSDLVIFDTHVAFPDPSNSNPSTQTVANDIRVDNAEGLLRSFCSANIGPTASAARKIADLTLSPDEDRGPTLQKSPRFQNLLELEQEIATGTDLLFDVVQVGDGRVFRVTEAVDVSASVRWDVDNRQLSSAKYGYGAPDVTHAIVAGQDKGTDRTIIEVTTADSLAAAAVWGRRERFVDQRQTDDVDELTQKGEEELAAGANVRSISVVPSSDMAAGFMSEWSLGSVVTVTVGQQEIVAPVVEVPIAFTRDGVFVGAVVGDPTGFDWESVLESKQRLVEARVSRIERDLEVPDLATTLATLTPVGSIEAFAGRSAPAGRLICNGASYGRATYPALYEYLCESLGTATVTIANPAVVTRNGHGFVAGDRVFFETTGALPTGLVANTVYVVLATGLTANTFRLSTTDGGAAIVTTGSQSGVHTIRFCPYGIASATTFNVPDYGDYVLVGAKTGSTEFPTVGLAFGAKKHALSASENGPHSHTFYSRVNASALGDWASGYVNGTGKVVMSSTLSSGNGEPHNIIQPSRAVLWCIKT